MKVRVDGQEMPFTEDLDEKIDERLKQENLVIRSLKVNGAEMVNASLADVLAEPAQGKVIEIFTCPADELLWEAMRDARQYIPKLQEGLPLIRERLLEGSVNAVYNMVDAALEGLEWLGLTFQAFMSQGKSPQLEEIFIREYGRFNSILKELEIALRANRLEAACEIFEQQVAPFLDKLLSLADEIIEEAPAKGKK